MQTRDVDRVAVPIYSIVGGVIIVVLLAYTLMCTPSWRTCQKADAVLRWMDTGTEVTPFPVSYTNTVNKMVVKVGVGVYVRGRNRYTFTSRELEQLINNGSRHAWLADWLDDYQRGAK